MAQVFKSVIGRLTGALGNMVFRNHEDITTITMRPRKYTGLVSEEMRKRRERFALTGTYSLALNRDENLKKIWINKSVNKKRPANQIFKENFKYISFEDISDSAIVAPEYGIGINLANATLTRTGLTVELEPLGNLTRIDTNVEKYIYMTGVVFCKAPIATTDAAYKMISVISPKISLNLVSNLTFNVTFVDDQTQIFDKYTEHKLFAAFITLDLTSEPVDYTNTIRS